MSTAVIPFAAKQAAEPELVVTSAVNITWNELLQLNEQPDGTPWHTMPQAASCTDTNQDGKGDDVSDPYYASAS
ncbi:hypothetical protein ACIBL6_16095 [Streptomyces sp. NPDC050400]|uniref:hypothetical protein n=1 Tax=Streptomyces sp. NPDC050400 TaxID=3365610 RepID=UPI003796D769